MNKDFRLSTSYFLNSKILRLKQRLGDAGIVAHIQLLAWTAVHRPDGNLADLHDDDIEHAAGWRGKRGRFVGELDDLKLLDGFIGTRKVHQWAEHNTWAAGAPTRSLKARWNAIKGHHDEETADKMVPEYAAIRKAVCATSIAASNATGNAPNATGTAPSPSPSPKKVQELLPTADAKASDLIWGRGVALLVSQGEEMKTARSTLGLARKELGEVRTADLVSEMERRGISNATEFIHGAIKKHREHVGRTPVRGRVTGKDFGSGSSDDEVARVFGAAA